VSRAAANGGDDDSDDGDDDSDADDIDDKQANKKRKFKVFEAKDDTSIFKPKDDAKKRKVSMSMEKRLAEQGPIQQKTRIGSGALSMTFIPNDVKVRCCIQHRFITLLGDSHKFWFLFNRWRSKRLEKTKWSGGSATRREESCRSRRNNHQ
jgi:hypothetical protein